MKTMKQIDNNLLGKEDTLAFSRCAVVPFRHVVLNWVIS